MLLKHTLRGAVLDTVDSILHAGNRSPWGTVYVGGQIGGADLDSLLWNESNAYGPHRGSSYWGWWGFAFGLGERKLATDLSIVEATAYEGSDEIARCPAGGTLHFTHGIKNDADADDTASAQWQYQLVNYSTGATVSGTYNANVSSRPTIAISPAAGSYLLRVRVVSSRPQYHGLPADYRAVTGQASDTPTAYRWTASNGKVYLYDFLWNVGAAPSDPEHPLRVLRAAAIASGTLKKNPAWSKAIMLIGEDGEPEASGGEWSALKMIVGAGSWPGDMNGHVSAHFPAFWRVDGAALAQVRLEPRLRAVGAVQPHGDDLWIGGFIAGRSGPQPCVIKFEETIDHTTASKTPLWSLFCECAMAGAKMVNSITWVGGVLHALTTCDTLILDPLTDTLIASHPGGRSGGSLAGPGGVETYLRATETDFSVNDKFAWGFNVILAGEPGTETVWRGTAHHTFACIGFKSRKAYYIEEPFPAHGPPGDRQYLAVFNGQSREQASTWLKTKYDLGQIGIAGQYAFAFGHTPDLKPTAVRFDTAGIDKQARQFEFELHVRNAATGLSADGKRETIFVIGKALTDGGLPAAGWGLYEIDPNDGTSAPGGEPKVCFFWNGVSQKFSLARSVALAAGVDLAKLKPYVVWSPRAGGPGGGVWITSAAAPIDGTPYLELLPDISVIISYHKPAGVTLPYDPNMWELICFAVQDDGSIGPEGEPNPTPQVPTDVPFPEGTTVRIVRYPAEGTTLPAPVEVVSAHGRVFLDDEPIDGFLLDELYPWLWLSIDGQLEISDSPGEELGADDLLALQEFTIRARGIDRHTALPLPARSNVRCAYFVPPGYDVPQKVLKDVS